MADFERGALTMRFRVLEIVENVVFRPTQDSRVKDGRIRCSVDELMVKLAFVSVEDSQDES